MSEEHEAVGGMVYAGEENDLVMDTLAKAMTGGAGARPAYVHHHTLDAARRYAMLNNGIREDNTPHLGANVLRRLADKNIVIRAVVNTIVNQVAGHFRKPEGDRGMGVRIIQKDRDAKLTAGVEKEARRILDILWRGGMVTDHPITGEPAVWDGHYKEKAPTLPNTVRLLMGDSLVLDGCFVAIEGSQPVGETRVRDNPVMFWKPQDAALIRSVDSDYYAPRIRNGNNGSDDLRRQVAWVQLDPGGYWGIMREFRWDEGDLAHRNPRTEFGSWGYGKSEVEQCLDAVLGVLFAMKSNKNYFTDNRVPLGILNLIGSYGEKEIERWRLQLAREIGTGLGGDYRFPVLRTPGGEGARGAQWVPILDRARMDMVFRAYIEFCTALVAAVFQIAPEEFGFASFGGAQQVLTESDPESAINQSQHRGLLPKVYFLCDYFTRNVVEKINPDFEVIIQGLDAVYNPELMMELQLDATRLMNGWTPNMIQRFRDEPEWVDPLDAELWEQVEVENENRYFPSRSERQRAMVKAYKEMGGKLGDWPNSPCGGAQGALQIWMQQHMADQMAAQEQMAGIAGDEVAGQRDQEMGLEQQAQGSMDQMNQMQFQNQMEQDNLAAQEAKDTSLSIPQADDAGFMRKRTAKSMRALSRRRLVTGPRDAP